MPSCQSLVATLRMRVSSRARKLLQFIVQVLVFFLARSLVFLTRCFSRARHSYRTCHNRLIVNAEEIAFYKGADKERAIITTALSALVRHSRRTRFLKFLVGIFDQVMIVE